MNNIFTKQSTTTGETFFSSMQKNLVGAIRGLLALYIIFYGYEYLVRKEGGIKQQDWHWFVLKFALVSYFAAGSGMADMLPRMQLITKEISIMVMNAGAGSTTGELTANTNLDVAQKNFEIASSELANARLAQANAQKALLTGGSQDDVNNAITAVTNKNTAYNEKLKALNDAKGVANSFGYNYCNFDGFTYPAGKESMRLWDMIDCKISKYLGVGEWAEAREAPMMLVMASVAIFGMPGLGILIFAVTIIVLAFVILVIVRVVHIYIIAFIALVLLVYISPLLIPAALFKFTKYIFDAWLKSLFSYMFQPILLFGFLAFLFATLDMVVYEGNHHFVPMTTNHSVYENQLCLKNINAAPGASPICTLDGVDQSNLVCEDEYALGCLLHHVQLIAWQPKYLNITLYDIRFASNFKSTMDRGWLILLGLLKFLLVCFIAYSVLELVEDMSRTLVNAAGGGAAAKSIAPKASVQDISNATVNRARSAAVGGVKKVAGAVNESNKKAKAARQGAQNKVDGG
jgi:type IV secretion system protein VirB6